MPRQSSKCRDWEKERRNRLNDGFMGLHKTLPSYDPAVTASKIEILQRAATYIEELHQKIKDLMSDNESEASKVKNEEVLRLQERIKRLLGKNEQLCILLREAKITIPRGCGFHRKFQKASNWSNKISPEQAKILQKKESEKENDENAKKVVQGRKFTSKPKSASTPKHRKVILNRNEPKKVKIRKRKQKNQASKCVIVITQPTMSQSCYVITNSFSNSLVGGSSTIITNSGLLSAPLVSSSTKNAPKSIPTLGPGTLILANGTIMPVIPPPTIIQRPLILVPKQTPKITIGSKILPRIRPKYCTTKTTQVNKVPIPALTSRYRPKTAFPEAPKPTEKKEQEKRKTSEEIVENEPKKARIEPEVHKPEEKAPPEQKTAEKIIESAKSAEKSVENESIVEKNSNLAPISTEVSKRETVENDAIKPPETELGASQAMEKALELNISHSELSNDDIFASLQVPNGGCQNPESTSPTAAFLLAFPLVSSGVKVTEVTEEDNNSAESQRGTPNLLQIGTMDTTKPTDSLTPSLLNLDNLSFFSSKDITGLYNSFENNMPVVTSSAKNGKISEKVDLGPFCDSIGNTELDFDLNKKQIKPKTIQNKSSCANLTDLTSYNFFTDNITPKSAPVVTSTPTTIPLTTTNTSYSYSYRSDSNFNHQNYYKNINISKNDNNRSYYSLNYENYSDYRKSDTFTTPSYYTNTTKWPPTGAKNKIATTTKAPINWMTTPDNKAPDYGLPAFNNNYPSNSFASTPQTNYFNNYGGNEERKSLDLPSYPQRSTHESDENQFSWSPTKLPQFLEHPAPPPFVSGTLPTLVGDLALNFNDKAKKNKNYDAGNFLSVSQLVDAPNRRNRAKKQAKSAIKPKSGQDAAYKNGKNNSYSAEALIGHQFPETSAKKAQGFANKPISVPFLADNIIPPYFPPVELPPTQENNYMHQNQNYQSGNFHNYNYSNTYTPNTFIPTPTSNTTTYLPTGNFEMADYSADLALFGPNKEKSNCKMRNNAPNECKRAKKKSEMPNFVDFSFLSMPNAINSPILPPDDFHTGFLQPSTNLYPCKNANNSSGTSQLTNFNLSTIFPEINNKQDGYLEPRSKEHSSRSYSSSQAFSEKAPFSFNYNSTSQSYNNP